MTSSRNYLAYLRSDFQVLGNAPQISAIFINSDELGNLIIFIPQFDFDPRAIVQWFSCTVL